MPPKKGTSDLRKRKNIKLSLLEKIEICNFHEVGVSRKAAMRKFKISAGTLYNVKAQKEELKRMDRLRKEKLKNLEDILFEWYTAVRSEVSKVSGSMFIEKAKYLHKEMKIKEPCTFSPGWLARFKLRYGIRRVCVKRKEAMKESVGGICQIYREFFDTLVAEYDLNSELIYSACETKLFWRSLYDSNLYCRKKPPKYELMGVQEHLAVMLCANASGTHKLSVFAVGQNEVEPDHYDSSMEYKVRKDGVMDKELYMHWFNKVFVPSVKLNLKQVNKPEDSKVLLLLDSSAEEILNSELSCGNIFTIFLPLNVTPYILPMNRGVIHDFNCNYRIDVMKKLSRHEMSVQYFLTQYSIRDVLVYLENAWKSVNTDVLRKSWQRLLPSSLRDEALEDLIGSS